MDINDQFDRSEHCLIKVHSITALACIFGHWYQLQRILNSFEAMPMWNRFRYKGSVHSRVLSNVLDNSQWNLVSHIGTYICSSHFPFSSYFPLIFPRQFLFYFTWQMSKSEGSVRNLIVVEFGLCILIVSNFIYFCVQHSYFIHGNSVDCVQRSRFIYFHTHVLHIRSAWFIQDIFIPD